MTDKKKKQTVPCEPSKTRVNRALISTIHEQLDKLDELLTKKKVKAA